MNKLSFSLYSLIDKRSDLCSNYVEQMIVETGFFDLRSRFPSPHKRIDVSG